MSGNKCECRVCLYGRKIRDLMYRTKNAVDKALIEELYDNLIHVEDDRDYHSILNEGYRIRNGNLPFSKAVALIDVKRKSAGSAGTRNSGRRDDRP